jgi:sigma-B regulation protein RsbU (phosphoserine phosphatase)
MPGLPFNATRVPIGSGDRLYVFSDGVYEVNYADREGMMTVEEFAAGLAQPSPASTRKVDDMAAFVRQAQGRDNFDDDFSLVELRFK